MWRSIVVFQEEKITIEDENLLLVTTQKETKIPLEDINCIVIDNIYSVVSSYAISLLSKYGIVTVFCDKSHLPTSIMLPLDNNYHLYKVHKLQLSMTTEQKNALWDSIIKAKILNQAYVLETSLCNEDVVVRMRQLAAEVHDGDIGNREGIAAKMFFRNLYGSNFIRQEDDAINGALNYGYSIIRSLIARNLVSFGFQTYLGIHHISETNAFNLADDFMEPYRPLVDMLVSSNSEELVLPLSKDFRKSLIDLINSEMKYDKKIMKVRNVAEMQIKNFYSYLDSNDPKNIIMPLLND